MLFYGKEVDFTTIIFIVVLILAAYIIFSYYQQQKQAIPIIFTSRPATTVTTVSIPEKTQLKNGAFALSLWIKLGSALQLSPSSSSPSSSFNLLRVTKKDGTSPSPLTLALDADGNLVVSTAMTILIFHFPTNPDEMISFTKNLSIFGGLMLLSQRFVGS